MSSFMNQLRYSGYDHQYRFQLLKGILDRRRQLEEKFESGEYLHYRSREQIVLQKSQKLGKFPNTWFLSGGAKNTLKVPATPGSALLKLGETW